MNDKFNKHTPLPWKVYYAKNNGQVILGTGEENGCAVQAHNGSFWRDDEEAKNNAEFVIHACNNHYELLEALENLANHDIAQDKREGVENCIELQNALSAIAKARGES